MESYIGRWRIDGSEEIVIGELRRNEEKWILYIESELKRNLERLDDEIKFIEGRLLDGREVTILNASVNYLSFGSGKPTLAEYDCETVIIGKYFEKEDLKFAKNKANNKKSYSKANNNTKNFKTKFHNFEESNSEKYSPEALDQLLKNANKRR